MDIEKVFVEVKRVLAPGGVFLFADEPLRRMLTLGLWRAPYYDTMKPWERKLYDWGLLGYLVRDVIGARQEESFGIRQNHTMNLADWHRLIEKHFAAHEYEILMREQAWSERLIKRIAVRLDPYRSVWRAARLLGGTLAAVCRKQGEPDERDGSLEEFHRFLRCPDCGGPMDGDAGDAVRCVRCGLSAANEGGVYNLLPSAERKELYPGDRQDLIDFCHPGHEARLLEGWYELEGVFGNKYRWIGEHAAARLKRVSPDPSRLRIRGHAQEGHPVRLTVRANGAQAGEWHIDRPGLFVLEADLADAAEYRVDIHASPVWQVPTDDRKLSVTLSMIRLVPRE